MPETNWGGGGGGCIRRMEGRGVLKGIVKRMQIFKIYSFFPTVFCFVFPQFLMTLELLNLCFVFSLTRAALKGLTVKNCVLCLCLCMHVLYLCLG